MCSAWKNRAIPSNSFFHNDREAGVFKAMYPSLYKVLVDKQIGEGTAAEQSVSIELKALIKKNPAYSLQVLVALLGKEKGVTLNFNDSEASTYWLKLVSKEIVEQYRKIIQTADLEKLSDILDNIGSKLDKQLLEQVDVKSPSSAWSLKSWLPSWLVTKTSAVPLSVNTPLSSPKRVEQTWMRKTFLTAALQQQEADKHEIVVAEKENTFKDRVGS